MKFNENDRKWRSRAAQAVKPLIMYVSFCILPHSMEIHENQRKSMKFIEIPLESMGIPLEIIGVHRRSLEFYQFPIGNQRNPAVSQKNPIGNHKILIGIYKIPMVSNAILTVSKNIPMVSKSMRSISRYSGNWRKSPRSGGADIPGSKSSCLTVDLPLPAVG